MTKGCDLKRTRNSAKRIPRTGWKWPVLRRGPRRHRHLRLESLEDRRLLSLVLDDRGPLAGEAGVVGPAPQERAAVDSGHLARLPSASRLESWREPQAVAFPSGVVGWRYPKVVAAQDPDAILTPSGAGLDGVVDVYIEIGVDALGCTGSLLTTGKHILTAAHCVADDFGELVAEYVDVKFELSSGTVYTTVEDIQIHPQYDGRFWRGYDVAVLELSSAAPAPAERYDIYRGTAEIGRQVQLVGYGYTGTGATGADSYDGFKRDGLNRYDALVDVLEDPEAIPGSQLVYDFDNGLAGNDAMDVEYGIADLGFGTQEANSAPGDSGGPTFIDGLIAGITSYGFGFDDEPGLPNPDTDPELESNFGEVSVDTRVSFVADWIDAVTGTPWVVGDRVWDDQDADGIQDAGEPGIAGAVVEVYASPDAVVGDSDDVLRSSTITDAEGHYRLGGLRQGENYYLLFRAPAGYTAFTTAHVGSHDGLDSDATANGTTALFTLEASRQDLTWDAGLRGSTREFGLVLGLGSTNDLETGYAVATDAEGNVYVTGQFQGSVDFDPGPNSYPLTSAGAEDAFLAKGLDRNVAQLATLAY
jgi:hypothetical protein